MKLCVVCMERPRSGSVFCEACRKSWEQDAEKDETLAAAIIWTAKRARKFERARKERKRCQRQ